MAGPSSVWKAEASPESRDYCVQPEEPINQSGLTTASDSLWFFSSSNKERRFSWKLLERVFFSQKTYNPVPKILKRAVFMQGPSSADGGQMFNPSVLFFVFSLIKT